MPPLRQLDCQIEWAGTNTAFEEYGTAYGDGVVETYIVIPSSPQTFSVRISSKGYICEGLAVLVFMDGEYQCNRNRLNLQPRKKGLARNATEIDFRLRQKEKPVGDGSFIGREWRFDTHNRLEGVPPDADAGHFDSLGTIEIIVLRCTSRLNDDARSTSSSGVDIDPLGRHSEADDDASDFDDAASDEGNGEAQSSANHAATTVEEEPGGFMTGLFDGASDLRDPLNLRGDGPTDGYWAYHPSQRCHGMHHGEQQWGPQPGYNAGPPPNSFIEQAPPHPPPHPPGPGKHVHFDMSGRPNTRAVPHPPQQQWRTAQAPSQAGPPPQQWQNGPAPGPDPSTHGAGRQGGYSMPMSPIPFDAIPPFEPTQAAPGYARSADWAPAGYMPYPYYPSHGYVGGHGYGGNPGYGQYPYRYSSQGHGYTQGQDYTHGQGYTQGHAYAQGQGYAQRQSMPANGPAAHQNWNVNGGKSSGDPAKEGNNQGDGWSNGNSAGGGATGGANGWNRGNSSNNNNFEGDAWVNNNCNNANNSGGDSGWGGNTANNDASNNGSNNSWTDDNKGGGPNNNDSGDGTGWGGEVMSGTPDPGNNGWDNPASNGNNQDDEDWNKDDSNNDQGGQTLDDNNNNNDSNNNQRGQNWGANDSSNQNESQNQANSGGWGETPTKSTSQPRNTWSPADAVHSSTMPGAFPDRALYGPHGPYYALQPSNAGSVPPEAEEEPRYDVPASHINATGSTHQVQPGRGYLWTHRRNTPQYLDDIASPYACFVFKYRTKEQLAREIGVQVDIEPSGDAEAQELAAKSKEEIIRLLLRAKSALGGRIPEPPEDTAKAMGEGVKPTAVPVPKKRVGAYKIPVRQARPEPAGLGLGLGLGLKDLKSSIPGWKTTPPEERGGNGWGNGNGNANANTGGGDGWGTSTQNQNQGTNSIAGGGDAWGASTQNQNQNSTGNDWSAGANAGPRPESPPQNGGGGGGGWAEQGNSGGGGAASGGGASGW
jgi:hypothetical protein